MEVTGTIEQSVSHHSSVFSISKVLHDDHENESTTVYYDFSESKSAMFIDCLSCLAADDSLGHNLEDFIDIYNAKIDEFFKLDKPKNFQT